MMNRVKDFFYNFSDIILAILLIVLIVFVLYNNLDYLVNSDPDKQVIAGQEKLEDKKKEAPKIEVMIPSGISVDQLSNILEGYELIDDKEAFVDLYEKKKDPEDIKAGTYKIKKDVDVDSLIEIISN